VDGTGPGREGRGLQALGAVVRRVAVAVAALGCVLPIAGCGLGSGITISSPAVMAVNSAAFQANVMPTRYTCAGGKALNPPLYWAGAPAGTRSFALVLDDSDAPITPYVYWIVFNISPATSSILEGQLPPGARQAQNSAGHAAYDPPCPGPQGHSYRFTVYALNTKLDLPNGASLLKTWTAIAAATIGRGRKPVSATS
jgi:Raf kinase inhibitor-like YbhB/YbcL family protein